MKPTVGRGRSRGQPRTDTNVESAGISVPGYPKVHVGAPKPINSAKHLPGGLKQRNIVTPKSINATNFTPNTAVKSPAAAAFCPAGYEDEDDWADDYEPQLSKPPASVDGNKIGIPAGFEDYDSEDEDFFHESYKPSKNVTQSNKNQIENDEKLARLIAENPDMDPELLRSLADGAPVLSFCRVETDAESLRWLERLETEWHNKRPSLSKDIGMILRDCYHSVPNPYLTALCLMAKSKDFYQGKAQGLYNLVMKELENWLKYNEAKVQHLLDNETKQLALQMTVRNHTICLEPVLNAYRLREGDPTMYIPYIKYLLAKDKYKEASQCVAKLGLYDHFTVKEICLPLILQDKINLVESYVFRNTNQQMELVKLLDYLCDKENDISLIIHENSHVPCIKREKLEAKPISKLAIRLMKLYEIPMEECPNINRSRRLSHMRYLLYRKYQQQEMNQVNWDEAVLSAVEDSQDLQLALVDALVDYLEIEEGARWAQHFNLPKHELPMQVADILNSGNQLKFQPVVGTEEWDDSEDWGDSVASGGESMYYQLSLPRDHVFIVSNKEEFYQSLGYLSKEGNIIGLDAEWKPIITDTFTRVALLQVADIGRVYLYDILQLSKTVTDEDWQNWGSQLLASDAILKLGFGFDQDIRVLTRSIPGIKNSLDGLTRFVDILELKNAILRVNPEVFDKMEDENGDLQKSDKVIKREEVGLSSLVRQCCGKPLDKAQQMSNWEFRPLRQAQIMYAALDAYVLLEVYRVLRNKIKQHNLQVPLEPAMTRRPAGKLSRQEKKQRRVAERPADMMSESLAEMQVEAVGPAIKPRDLAVVADTMLQGLGRHLRCCGVDVIILDNNQDHDECGKIARRDGRIILTSGLPYQTLKSQVGEGRCINVAPGKARDQAVYILKLLNVTVTKEDIFSRCQICNGTEFTQVPVTLMIQAIERNKELSQNHRQLGFGYLELSGINIERENVDDNDYESLRKRRQTLSSDYYDEIYKKYGLHFANLSLGAQQIPLDVEKIPDNCLEWVKVFHVCMDCGRIYWNGIRLVKPYEEMYDVFFPDVKFIL